MENATAKIAKILVRRRSRFVVVRLSTRANKASLFPIIYAERHSSFILYVVCCVVEHMYDPQLNLEYSCSHDRFSVFRCGIHSS